MRQKHGTGKKRLAGDTASVATSTEVKDLRRMTASCPMCRMMRKE
ncbi:hypothetical protein [uncultured Ruegeria sp.]|nr:hypothetical protein [uncultured Ruegeria sp.]